MARFSRKNKYHAVPTGGYHSRKECKRARQLHILEKAGEISELREQVPFELLPNQYAEVGTDAKGRPVRKCVERKISYIADFVYRDARGNLVIEDVKGVLTPEYKIKRKLMLFFHGMRITEITDD